MQGLNLTPRVKQLAICIAVASILVGGASSWLDVPLASWVALEPMALLGRGASLPGIVALWQVVTYPWIALSPFDVVFSVLALAFFVSDLERAWGERLFLDRLALLWLGTTAGVLVIAALYPPVRLASFLGPSPFFEALFIAWGFSFPTRTLRIFFMLPVQAELLAWITLALTFLTPVFYGPESLGWIAPYLVSAALGFAYGKTPLSLRRMWLRVEERRLKRVLERERNERLH